MELNIFNPSSVNIEELSIQDIDNLIPRLEETLAALVAAEKTKPIDVVVEETFSESWGKVKNELTSEFSELLDKEREEFTFNQSMHIVLEPYMGGESVKAFFRVIQECIKIKSFRSNKRFYQRVADQKVREAAQVGFAVYRLHMSKSVKDDFVGGKWIKNEIKSFGRRGGPVTQSVLKDFSEVGLIPD